MGEQLDLVVESMVLKLPNCSCPRRQRSVLEREPSKYTHSANNVVEVPYLLEDGSVRAAAEVRDGTSLRLQGGLDLRQRVGGLVRREDARGGEHVERREHFERAHDGLKEVHDILVLLVVGAVARDVEGGRAGSVLGELQQRLSTGHAQQGHGAAYLMSPETAVDATLADPVLVH